MLLILGCLNTKFGKLLLSFFRFQMTLLNGIFINILKAVGPTYYDYFKYMFSKHFLNHSFHIILNNNTQTPLCKIQTTPNFTLEFIISFKKKLF